tara:strand:+ start:210 stop:452 length:243 start_codon:yes stop_codon:yes gene_type:complete
VKTLYIHDLGNGCCITHDGYIQLGYMCHSLEKHKELNPTINWVVTYWLPDVFKDRYPRATMQSHQRISDGKLGCEKLKDK